MKSRLTTPRFHGALPVTRLSDSERKQLKNLLKRHLGAAMIAVRQEASFE